MESECQPLDLVGPKVHLMPIAARMTRRRCKPECASELADNDSYMIGIEHSAMWRVNKFVRTSLQFVIETLRGIVEDDESS